MPKKKPNGKRGRPATNPPELTIRFAVRCSPEQMKAYEAEAEALGYRRGPHDTGVGMLARRLLDAYAAGTLPDGTTAAIRGVRP